MKIFILLLIPFLLAAKLKDTRVDGKLYVGSTQSSTDIVDNSFEVENVFEATATGVTVINKTLKIGDTNTGGNAGSDLCLGADNTVCVCGTCN